MEAMEGKEAVAFLAMVTDKTDEACQGEVTEGPPEIGPPAISGGDRPTRVASPH